MGRVSTFFLSCLVFISITSQAAQQDSVILPSPYSLGIGLQLTQAMFSAPAVAGQIGFGYKSVGLDLRYGRNKAKLQNVKQFDELKISGDWAEINLHVILPVRFRVSKPEGIRLGLGIGTAKTTTEFTEVFESLPPFQDYKYIEKYENVREQFISFSLGREMHPHQNVKLGIGVAGFKILNKPSLPLSTVITPFKARSPIGFYLELGYSL